MFLALKNRLAPRRCSGFPVSPAGHQSSDPFGHWGKVRQHLKLETRNSEPGTRNPEPGTRSYANLANMDILLSHGYFLRDDAVEQEVMKPYPPLGLLYLRSSR